MSRSKKKKLKTKRPKVSQADRIWKKFCNLSHLDQYYVVYDSCGLYDDFRSRIEDAESGEYEETLDSLEEEIDSIRKGK